MTRSLTLSALALTLAACETAPAQQDACAATSARTDRFLAIDAQLMGADGHAEAIDCATFTVTKPDSDWQVTGATPSEIDLAPGEYEVEVDWATEDCAYVSAPTTVHLDATPELAKLDLCVDMEGAWTCTDGDREWTESARMNGGCTLTLPETGIAARVLGHRLEGPMVGEIAWDGATFEAVAEAGGPLSCWR